VSIVEVRGEASDEEVAAIIAAVSHMFVSAEVPEQTSRSSRWRFSGRAWLQDRFDNRPH
jgi:hypothetical protein